MNKLFLWILTLTLFCTWSVGLAETISVLLIPGKTTEVSEINMFDPFDGHYLGVFATLPAPIPCYNVIQGPDDNIYVSEYGDDKVHVFDAAGNYLYIYADGTDGLTFVRGIAFRGDHLFIPNGEVVMEFDGPHSRLPDFITNPDVETMHEIFFMEDGRSLVSVAGIGIVRLYNADGTPSADVFNPPTMPQQIQSDPQLPGAFLNTTYNEFSTITDFDLDGTIHNTISIPRGSGIYRLENGNLLATNARGDDDDCVGVVEITNAGDTVDVQLPGVRCYFIELCDVEVGGSDCAYIPGDCDHNGTPLELGDVIAMIGMYRGSVDPYYICDCGVDPPGAEFAATADPNGNCVALELGDVVTEIAAYRGTGEASGCVDCPGSG